MVTFQNGSQSNDFSNYFKPGEKPAKIDGKKTEKKRNLNNIYIAVILVCITATAIILISFFTSQP